MSASDNEASEPDDEAGESSDEPPRQRERRPKKKQPFISAFLSLVVAGLGQVYNGQYLRGSAFILVALVVMLLTLGVERVSLQASAFGLLFHVVAAYDAYRAAQRINADAAAE